MKNRQDLNDTDIDRSQAFIAAVLGPEEVARLDGEAIDRTHNRPPEPIEPEPTPEDKRVADLIEAANKWAEQHPVIETEDVAAACVDYLGQLDAQWKEFDGKFREEKKPHEDALQVIRTRWHPRLERLDICRRAIRPLERAWLRLKDLRLRQEREAAEREAADAQRRADQLAEQAKGGGPGTVTNMIGAREAAQEADRARQAVAAVPQRAQVRGNLGGRTRSLRSVWRADLVVIEEALGHYKSHREVKDLLTRLANADARAGVRWIPGFHVYREEV